MTFRYTPEMLDFLRAGYLAMCLADLTVAFNREFGLDKPESSIRGATRNHGMKSGRTGQFYTGQPAVPGSGCKVPNATSYKPGRPAHEARNYLPIGSTRITKDGYIERKVTDDPALVPARRWVGEHRLVWEAANGPIPDGHVVVFLDGDRLNIDLDNLRCVPRAVLQWMNKTGLNETSGEARKAAILTAEVVARSRQLERNRRPHAQAQFDNPQ